MILERKKKGKCIYYVLDGRKIEYDLYDKKVLFQTMKNEKKIRKMICNGYFYITKSTRNKSIEHL